MEELIELKKLQDVRQELEAELEREAEGFIKIGYILKHTRDQELFVEGGYKTLYEFAKAEYGLDKSTVSRFMAINDRYSENGNSAVIAEKYKGFGRAKLSEMLTLPLELEEEIRPETTRQEIRDLKKEYREELEEKQEEKEEEIQSENQQESNLKNESCAGATNAGNTSSDTDFDSAILWVKKLFYKDSFKEKMKDFLKLFKQEGVSKEKLAEQIQECIAPNGYAQETVRLPEGKLFIFFKDSEEGIGLVQGSEKQSITYTEFFELWIRLFQPEKKTSWQQLWENTYQESVEKKENKEQGSQKLTKEEQSIKSKLKEEQTESESHEEEQIPGQKNIEDYPEYLPDTQDDGESEIKEKPIPQEIPQNAPDIVIEPKLFKKGEPRESITHYVKCRAMFFEDAAAGIKSFELRINDRDYRVGDILHMTEYKDGHNTERFIEEEIVYMLEEFAGLKENYCILGTKLLSSNSLL
jgi:hypothetical protein